MRPGILFVLAVAATALLALGDVTLATTADRSGFDHGGLYTNEERAVYAQSVVMRPGDRLAVWPNLAGGWPTVASYDFYVVPGGDRFALLAGEAPRAIYVEQRNTSLQGCCPNPWLAWDRPDDAFARRDAARAPAPVEAPAGMDASFLDEPERIDLVWVLHYGPGVAQPTTQDERNAFEARLMSDMRAQALGTPPLTPAYPTVYEARVVTLHPLMTWTMAALALGATASLGFWAARLRKARFEPEGPGTESLLRLYDAAGSYLGSLRDVLLGSLVVLASVALHVALVGEPEAVYHLLKAADIGVGASQALGVSLAIAYAAVAAAWIYAIWSVHRSLRRWRDRRARPPLDLAQA